MALDAAQIGSSEIRIYQRDAVLAEVTATEALVVAEDAQVGLEQRGLGRLVGAYTAAPQAAATLVISPNRPRLTGRTVTTIRWNDNAWQADFDYFFHVTEGQVEQIRLEVPSWWNGPYRVDSPATIQVVEVPGRDCHRLVIRPRTAIAGQHHLHLEATLPSTDQQRLRVPHIVTLNRGQVERFLVLPTRLDRQQLVWTTRGLQPAELPPSLELPHVFRHAPRVVRVVEHLFTAIPQTLPEVTTAPQIRLADIRIVPAEPGHEGRGLASFDLSPARLASCFVQLPPNCDLIQAAVEGHPAEVKRLDDQRWHLLLHSTTLPQRVDILFRTAAYLRGNWRTGRPWQAPVLAAASGPIPVERTLWTVSQSRLSPRRQVAAAGSVDARHQALTRLEATDSMLDLPREITDQVPLDQRVRWYRSWARRLQFQLDAVGQQGGQSTATDRTRIQAIAARQTEIAERLGTTAVLAEVKRSSLVAQEPSELFDTLLETDVAPARFVFPAAHTKLELRRGWQFSQGLAERFAAAALIVVASVIAVLCIRSGRCRFLGWGWPHSIATIGGLAWWLWLRPSLVGWLLIVAVAIWTLYRGVRHHDAGMPTSDDPTGNAVEQISAG
jgi:hypothetical protein